MIISKDSKIPALYAQEEVKDPLVYVSVKIGSAFWLLTEFDPKKNLAFGWAELFAGGGELGYISVEELEEAIDSYGGQIVNYKEPIPLSKLKREFQ